MIHNILTQFINRKISNDGVNLYKNVIKNTSNYKFNKLDV